MKAVKTFVLITAACISFTKIQAQQNSSAVSKRAILFADSLLKSFRYNNFDQYTDLSYPGVISYYGGKKNFLEYVQRTRTISEGISSENLKLVQILNDISEWQCVVEKTSEALIDGKKAHIVSYLVGQSKDEGRNWTFFDVAFNPVDNVVYIMPDIFERLSIPQRQVVFEKNSNTGKM